MKMAAHASNSCKVTHSNEPDASLQEYMSHAGTVQWKGQPRALHQRLRQHASVSVTAHAMMAWAYESCNRLQGMGAA